MASIRQRGGRFQARVRQHGYPLEEKTFATKAEAQRWIRQVEQARETGTTAPSGKLDRITLGELIERYRDEVVPQQKGRNEHTIKLNALLRHPIAAYSITHLTPARIAQYRDERLETCKASTVVRDCATLSAVINHARKEWGVPMQNPVQMIRKPSAGHGRNRTLSVDEERRLFEKLAATKSNRRNPLMLPLVIIALETAMRRGELLSLTWGNVHLDKRYAYLPDTKNGRPRYVPLSTKALETLAALPKQSERVFPIEPQTVAAAFMKAVKRAGLHDFRFHDIRHTAASRMSAKLPNVIELAAVTGHSSLQMLKRYYHPRPEELAAKLG